MRKYLLAAAAAAAIASPAAARDGSGYVGIEGGLLFPHGTDIHVDASASHATEEGSYYFGDYLEYYAGSDEVSFRTGYKNPWEVDVIGGYDFGMFRVEGELAYKKAKHEEYSTRGDDEALGALEADGKTSAFSAMVNGLVDFGNQDGLNFSVGGGIGWAKTKYRFSINDPEFDPIIGDVSSSTSDSGLAWQLLAAARLPISSHVDAGVKYRYFRAGKISETFDDGFGNGIDVSTRFKSHSILASLIYNFAGAEPPPPPPVEAAPPPPPPPPPATQTCPDGSVILATEVCPAAPPPPPPPPPAPERG